MATHFSGYRFLWVQVLFDLPVTTKSARKQASDFRNFLLDQGFEMSQYSVYQRFCASRELADTHIRQIEKKLPESGRVHILVFTDKQYGAMVTFRGKKKNPGQKNPNQYVLF